MRRQLVPIAAAALCGLADPAAARATDPVARPAVSDAVPAAVAPVDDADPPPASPQAQPSGAQAARLAALKDLDTSQMLRRTLSASVANGPNDSSLKSSITPDFQLTATSKDKIASFSWTIDVTGRSRSGNLSADQFTLTASSKLDGDGQATFIGLKGLTGGTEIKLTYIHYGSKVVLNGLEKSPVTAARSNCLDVHDIGIDDPNAAVCNPYTYPGVDGAPEGVSAFVNRYNPNGLGALRRLVLPGPMWFYGLDFAGGQTSYSYLDRTAFALKDVKRFGFGGSVFGGLIFNGGSSAIELGFNYQRKDQEQDPVQLCQPVVGTPQSQCLTGPDGLPERKTNAIASANLRWAFGIDPGSGWKLAVSPAFNIDVKSKWWSVDMPLYLVGDGSGKLRGGVRAVYLNEPKRGGGRKDGLTLALFIGVPFSLFHH